jgi:hypothetical protein
MNLQMTGSEHANNAEEYIVLAEFYGTKFTSVPFEERHIRWVVNVSMMVSRIFRIFCDKSFV